MTQSIRRRRVVSPVRRRVLERLAAAEETLTASALHGEGEGSIGNTYAALLDLTELGWVEKLVDQGTERRRGAHGRKPRGTYRITERGKTALIETELEAMGS